MDPGLLSVLDYGAIGDGVADETPALRRAFDDGALKGRIVVIPAGTYRHAAQLELRGVVARGEEGRSVLIADNPTAAALRLTGQGAGLSGLTLINGARRRATTSASAAIDVAGARDFTLDHLRIEGSASAGILVRGGRQGRIHDNHIAHTLADAIHITDAARDIEITGNQVVEAGDDGIAVVSYRVTAPVERVRIAANTVLANIWGRNISVVGGRGVRIEDNHVEGNAAGLAGLYIAGERHYDTLGAVDVLALNNTLIATGGRARGHAQVMIYNNADSPSDNVILRANTLLASPFAAIKVSGPGNRRVGIESNRIDGVGDDAITLNGATGATTITDNRITHADGCAVFAAKSNGATLTITANRFAEVARKAEAVIILGPGTLNALSITANRLEGPGPRFLDDATFTPSAVVADNRPGD